MAGEFGWEGRLWAVVEGGRVEDCGVEVLLPMVDSCWKSKKNIGECEHCQWSRVRRERRSKRGDKSKERIGL